VRPSGLATASVGDWKPPDETLATWQEMQVKLLRVLQERKVRPVGGDEEVPFEARVVTATNRDLETEVEEKRFREDLFYRINVVAIPVPPLRARASDVLLLAQWFLRRSAARNHKPVEGISPAAAQMLMAYDWPGNVRELRNVVERAVVLSEGSRIGREHLPEQVVDHARGNPRDALDVRQRVASVERETVVAALDAADGNQTQAARKLGISRFALIRMMTKHDIKRR